MPNDVTKLALGDVRDALHGIAAVATLLTTDHGTEVDQTALLLLIARTAHCADGVLEQIEREHP